MLQVVAGIIQRDGQILICRRTASQSHPLQWEFPGGKVEPGEAPEQALARELEEELAIRHAGGLELSRTQFTYPGKQPIELIFFRVHSFTGELENRIFHEMRWVPVSELKSFDFVEGDREFIRWLSESG